MLCKNQTELRHPNSSRNNSFDYNPDPHLNCKDAALRHCCPRSSRVSPDANTSTPPRALGLPSLDRTYAANLTTILRLGSAIQNGFYCETKSGTTVNWANSDKLTKNYCGPQVSGGTIFSSGQGHDCCDLSSAAQ